LAIMGNGLSDEDGETGIGQGEGNAPDAEKGDERRPPGCEQSQANQCG
jgi:hypothetical protein